MLRQLLEWVIRPLARERRFLLLMLTFTLSGLGGIVAGQDDPFSDEPWTGGWEVKPSPLTGARSNSVRFDLSPDLRGFLFQGPESVPIVEVRTRLLWTYRDRPQRTLLNSGGWFEKGGLRIRGQMLQPNRFQITFDLDGRHTPNHLLDGWVSREIFPGVDMRIGLSPSAIGFDDARTLEGSPFISPSLLRSVDFVTDLGISLHGDWIQRALTFDFSALAGDGFGFRGENSGGNSGDFRILLFPFQPGFIRPESEVAHPTLSSLHLMTGARWTGNWRGPIQIDAPSELPILRSQEFDAESRQAVRVGLGLDSGSVHLEAEWGYSGFAQIDTPSGSEDIAKAIEGFRTEIRWRPGHRFDSHRSRWSLLDDYRVADGIVGNWPRSLFTGLEIDLRYENSNVGRKLIDSGLIVAGEAPTNIHSTTVAVGFDVVKDARCTLEMSRSECREPIAAFGNRTAASTLAVRIELGF